MRTVKYYLFVALYYWLTLYENVRDVVRGTKHRLTHNHLKFFAVNTAFLATFEAWKEYLVLAWPLVLVLTFALFLRDEF